MSETTRQKILQEAVKAFSEKGYKGTSMREIAEALHITKPALYYHFPGKEELFTACVKHGLEHVVRETEELAAAQRSFWEKVETLVLGMCNFSSEYPRTFTLFKMIIEQSFDREINKKMLHDYFNRLHQALETMVETGVSKGELRDDIPAKLLSSAFSGIIHHTSGPKLKDIANTGLTQEEQVAYLIKLLKGGFARS
jgi:AcrR family transcriptional regulator